MHTLQMTCFLAFCSLQKKKMEQVFHHSLNTLLFLPLLYLGEVSNVLPLNQEWSTHLYLPATTWHPGEDSTGFAAWRLACQVQHSGMWGQQVTGNECRNYKKEWQTPLPWPLGIPRVKGTKLKTNSLTKLWERNAEISQSFSHRLWIHL